MNFIGVAGQARFGKDLLADYLHNQLHAIGFSSWERRAFASNVKKVYCDTFGVDLEFVEKWKPLSEAPPGFDMTVRQSLQFIGDGFRKIKPSIWLDLIFDKKTPTIISDVRYINEFLRVKQEDGLNILIARPDMINDDPNGSEAQIKPYVEWALKVFPPEQKFVELRRNIIVGPFRPEHFDCFDVFIRNDGSIEDLHQVVDTQLIPYLKTILERQTKR